MRALSFVVVVVVGVVAVGSACAGAPAGGEGEGDVGEGEGDPADGEGEGEGEGDGGGSLTCGDDEIAPADPGASVDGWDANGGSVVDDNGAVQALFTTSSVCDGDASLSKNVAMPHCYMPLALRLEETIVSSGDFGPLDATSVSIGSALLDFG